MGRKPQGAEAKSVAQRVREAEAAHLDRGERQIRVWCPGPKGGEAEQQIRALAARLCGEAAADDQE